MNVIWEFDKLTTRELGKNLAGKFSYKKEDQSVPALLRPLGMTAVVNKT